MDRFAAFALASIHGFTAVMQAYDPHVCDTAGCVFAEICSSWPLLLAQSVRGGGRGGTVVAAQQARTVRGVGQFWLSTTFVLGGRCCIHYIAIPVPVAIACPDPILLKLWCTDVHALDARQGGHRQCHRPHPCELVAFMLLVPLAP